MPGPTEMDKILYPESKPFNEGELAVDAIHTIRYKEYGNKNGIPVVYLHGGPAAGCAPYFHRFFDPDAFHIIIYDQRGAPLSTPPAETTNNSPAHLVEDNEKLRVALGIDKWHLFGGSWGSTLALLYAEKYPEHVSSMTLRGVFMMREKELDWFVNRMGTFFPEVRNEFLEFLPPEERKDALESYYQRLINPDPAVHMPAARAWTRYENGSAFLELPRDEDRNSPPEQVLGFARIEAHFMRNYMPDDSIMQNVDKIKHIPTAIVQGRHDDVCPPETAYDLARKLDNCSLQLVLSGHSGSQPETMKGLVAATNRIRDTGSPVLPKITPPAAQTDAALPPKP
ncbi:MAG: prolyl aminopeptidase [Proteobacteria bacterium]|nr:prolyl aminopeptidase [Pseudomonadota bacterium]